MSPGDQPSNQPRLISTSRPQAAGHLVANVAERLRGRRNPIDADAWALIASSRAERRLDQEVLLERLFQPFRDGTLFGTPPALGPFAPFERWTEHERVGVVPWPGVIEPESGWVVCRGSHLLRRGVIDVHDAPRPSVRRYAAGALARRNGRIEATEVVSLRDGSEHNFGHLLTDLIGGRLRLAEEAGLPSDIPLLVSKRLAQCDHFQEILRMSGLRDRPLILQDDQFVRVRRAYAFETSHYSPGSATYLQRLLAVPDGDRSARRRLLVLRRAGAGRAFSNVDAVLDVCRRFGFEVLEPDSHSFAQSVERFSQARVVVGATGSALSNMVFRRNAPLTVVEISPPGQRPPVPWWFFMARTLGHAYEALPGGDWADGATGRAARLRDFAVDPDGLARTLAGIVDAL